MGTTSVRVLEHVATAEGLPLRECSGSTNIFIYPPYNYKVVDALITNFHLPQSTLLMLVSAFAGRELVMKAYLEAIRERYRFFLLWRLHVDFVRSRRFFQVSFGKSADGFKDCLREGAAGGGTAAERRPGKNWSSGFF